MENLNIQDRSKRPPEKEYGRGSIEGHSRDRGIEEYSYNLCYDITSLPKGSLVLDLGSGRHATFAKQASLRDIRVVSLSWDYMDKKHRKVLRGSWIGRLKDRLYYYKYKDMSVASKAQSLPFADNSFDFIAGEHSFTNWCSLVDCGEDYDQFLHEVIRCLKPGKSGRFYPINKSDTENDFFRKLVEKYALLAEIKIEYPADFAKRQKSLRKYFLENLLSSEFRGTSQGDEFVEEFLNNSDISRILVVNKR